MGRIKSVFVRMESSETDSSWHLNKVEVGPTSGKAPETYVYMNWLEPGFSTMLYKLVGGGGRGGRGGQPRLLLLLLLLLQPPLNPASPNPPNSARLSIL